MDEQSLIEAVAKGAAPAIKAHVQKAIDASIGLDADIMRSLEARIAALEGQRAMHFNGPHDPAKTYAAGAVVQRSGAVWVAMIGTNATPGADPTWRRIAGDR